MATIRAMRYLLVVLLAGCGGGRGGGGDDDGGAAFLGPVSVEDCATQQTRDVLACNDWGADYAAHAQTTCEDVGRQCSRAMRDGISTGCVYGSLIPEGIMDADVGEVMAECEVLAAEYDALTQGFFLCGGYAAPGEWVTDLDALEAYNEDCRDNCEGAWACTEECGGSFDECAHESS